MSGSQKQQRVTLEEVQAAINALYKGADVTKKDEASRWLEHFQHSVHAWELSSQLLHLNPDTETSYFAAQTMRSKIQYHFAELPIDTHNVLKNSLMQQLKTFQKDSKSTITQLCLALADLATQSPQWNSPVNELIQGFSTSVEELPILLEILAYLPEEVESPHLKVGRNRREEFSTLLRKSSETVLHLLLCLALADLATQSPQWNSPVNELIQGFSTSVEELPILLEILAYLPEEVESPHLKVGRNRREEFSTLLRKSSETVLHLLLHCQKNCPADEKVQCKIYYCFGSWLELGSFPPSIIANSDLLRSVFETLLAPNTSTTLHDTVTDCICSALYISEDTNRHRELAELCFNFVMSLAPAYEKSVKDGDLDRAINYTRLFTEMACSLLDDVLSSVGSGTESSKTIHMLLLFLDHPEYEVAEITFRFWYRFAETLYKDFPDSILDKFRPHVQTLIMKVFIRCQLDSDHEGPVDLSDDFQDFRYRAIDVVQDTVFIFGYTTCFLEILKQICAQGTSWNRIEAGMFVMRSIANKVSQSNLVTRDSYQVSRSVSDWLLEMFDLTNLARSEESVGDAVKLIIQLPQNSHIALKMTSLELLAELTPWVDEHPAVVDSVFQFILNGLQSKELVSASATAFEHLLVDCSRKLTSNFQIIVQVVNAIDSLGLPVAKADSILRGAAYALSSLPYGEIEDALTHLCIPHVSKLDQIIKEAQGVKRPRDASDPVVPIDRLSTIFKNTAPDAPEGKEHPCQSVIEKLWPVLSHVADKFKHDERIMERICRCLRYAIRCVGKGFRNLLQPFVEQMITIYYQHQHSCFLYLGSVLVDEYGQEPNCAQGLIEMLKAFSGPTFTLLSAENGLMNHPDTVDDFFRLSIRLLQKCPIPFLENESMEAVLQLATAASTLNHREAHASTLRFLVDLVRCTGNDPSRSEQHRRNTLVTGLINQHGANIVRGLIKATAGEVQTYMVPDVADVIWELLSQYREPTCQWLKDALNSLPSHSPTGAIYATPEQIANFYQSVTSATAINEVWRTFREFCRLYQ
eukprot:gene5455-631_t